MTSRSRQLSRPVLLAIWCGLLLALPALTLRSSPPEAAARKTLVVLGDSLAAGYGVDPGESFPALLQQKVDAVKLPFTVVNAGVSGDTTAGGLRRLDWLLRRPVDILLVELGGNDGLRGLPIGATRTNLAAIISRTREKNPSVRIIVAGMQMPPNLGEDYVTQFRALFPDVAKDQHALLIPFLLEGVGGVSSLNQADQIHPTAEGHALIASNLWRFLEPVLRQSGSE